MPNIDAFSVAPLRPVSDAERACFSRDGVVHLRAIYPSEWVQELAACLDDVFDGHGARRTAPDILDGRSVNGARADMVQIVEAMRRAMPDAAIAAEGGATATLRGRSLVETDAASWHTGLRQHHLRGPLPEIVAQLTATSQVNFYSDQLFLKEPGSRVKTPFHQDKPYFLVDGDDFAVCWVPVDVVNRDNGPMGYVRGSHRWGKTFAPSDFVTENGTFPEQQGIDLRGLTPMPQIDPALHDVVYFDAQPGDVIVHHWATIHGSAGNVSTSARRRAASVRYACAGCHFYQRPSSPEPFRFAVGLNDGDPLEKSPRFPVVWPR